MTRLNQLQRFSKVLSGLSLIALAALTQPANAQDITVTNKLANHYANNPFPTACPNGLDIRVPAGYRIERPHYVYNDKTKQYVLWAHYEASGYGLAQAMVATSPNECGPYQYVRSFRPLNKEVRDDFLFKDTDGTAYFVAASNKNGGANDTMAIFRLTADYLDVDPTPGFTWAFEWQWREAPIVTKVGSVYYLLTSQAAGWMPSQAAYATSTSMLGPWSPLTNLGNKSTFGGQNADIKVINGTAATSHILVLDHLGGPSGYDDGNLFLPVFFDPANRKATLNWYSSFNVNLHTGQVKVPSSCDLAVSGVASAISSAPGTSPQMVNDGDYGTQWVAATRDWPAWWMVDLGTPKPIREIDISWFMYKGSEGYYKYMIDYSTDGGNWTTIDRSDNTLYGFTSDQVAATARFIRIRMLDAKLFNNPYNWYTPTLWDVRILPDTPSNKMVTFDVWNRSAASSCPSSLK